MFTPMGALTKSDFCYFHTEKKKTHPNFFLKRKQKSSGNTNVTVENPRMLKKICNHHALDHSISAICKVDILPLEINSNFSDIY